MRVLRGYCFGRTSTKSVEAALRGPSVAMRRTRAHFSKVSEPRTEQTAGRRWLKPDCACASPEWMVTV
jgi:hypothetical protein